MGSHILYFFIYATDHESCENMGKNENNIYVIPRMVDGNKRVTLLIVQ